MWIIILKKWRFEGTLHNEDFHRYTIHMFPLCFVTYEILHEINIDLLRIHTPEMYINVWKKGGFEHTIHAWGFVCTIYIPPNTPPPLKRKRYLVRYTIPSVIYIHRIRLNTPVNACKFSKKWRSKGTIHKWWIVQTEFICQETPPSLLKYHMNFKFIRFVQIQTDEYKSDISCCDEKLIFFVICIFFM